MASLVAQRYAQAFFDYAGESNRLDTVNNDLIHIEGAINSSQDFQLFLSNPVIASDKRQDILNLIWKDRVDTLTLRFLMFLTQKKRLAVLKDISGHYQKLYQKAKNILKIKIISTIALPEQQINDICHRFKLRLRKDIEAESDIQKDILGGVKIQVGDIIYDYSLQSQLEKFKDNVIHA